MSIYRSLFRAKCKQRPYAGVLACSQRRLALLILRAVVRAGYTACSVTLSAHAPRV